MSTVWIIVLVAVLWVLIGSGAALFWLGRRGHRSGSWYLIGVALGPLFVPIAIERGRRDAAEPSPAPTPGSPATRTVLVGVDGSTESDQAVREAADLFPGPGTRVVLVTVIDPDVVEFAHTARRLECEALLDSRAAFFPDDGPIPEREVVSGQPDRALLTAARRHAADVVLIGRRGRGLSHRLLGSVADQLVGQQDVKVLLASRPTPSDTENQGDVLAHPSDRRP